MRKKFAELHVELTTKRKIEVLAKMSNSTQSNFVKGFVDDLFSVAMYEKNSRGYYVFKIVLPKKRKNNK